VDSLPLLNTPNNLGQQLNVAVADTTTFSGTDYYIIGLVQYTETLSSDLPPTTLRGYVQLNDPAHPATRTTIGTIIGWPQPNYLGPVIVASENRPVRVLFINLLPINAGGNLFIPTDITTMGAGTGRWVMLRAFMLRTALRSTCTAVSLPGLAMARRISGRHQPVRRPPIQEASAFSLCPICGTTPTGTRCQPEHQELPMILAPAD
jgi:hypothetical protein